MADFAGTVSVAPATVAAALATCGDGCADGNSCLLAVAVAAEVAAIFRVGPRGLAVATLASLDFAVAPSLASMAVIKGKAMAGSAEAAALAVASAAATAAAFLAEPMRGGAVAALPASPMAPGASLVVPAPGAVTGAVCGKATAGSPAVEAWTSTVIPESGSEVGAAWRARDGRSVWAKFWEGLVLPPPRLQVEVVASAAIEYWVSTVVPTPGNGAGAAGGEAVALAGDGTGAAVRPPLGA